MKFFKSGYRRLVKACAIVAVAAGIAGSAPGLFAATAAGTQIKNLATVTYQDAAGNVYSAQSNEAIVTVAQVYSATLGTDTVSYTHLRAHETDSYLVCRLLLEKKK